MGTVPTGKLERELRKHYLQWLGSLPADLADVAIAAKINDFAASSKALIEKMGGRIASLGALGDFPAPKLLEMSPYIGKVYDQMQQAAIQAGIMTGLQSKDIARQMFNAGMDKSYRRLERLARTETVSAYWKNQWDSTADLPMLVMVWGSERGPRTCDYCLSRNGLVVEDSSIRDHPNGRCTLIPTLRSQVKYIGTLQPDGTVDMDPNWDKPAVEAVVADLTPRDVLVPQRDTNLSAAQYKKIMDRGDVLERTASNYRDETIHSHDAYMKILAKQNRMSVPALQEKLVKAAQELVDGGTPSIMVKSSDLGSILADGFKTTRQTGTGIGSGSTHKAYLETRGILEEAYYGPGKNPVYGFFDNPAVKGRGTLADYGDVQVVLRDDVRKRATASLGDSLDDRVMPANATAMDHYAIKNKAQLLTDGADSVVDYIEMQVADLSVADIQQLVFTKTPSPAIQEKLRTLGIDWKVRGQ